jgi:kynurenine--oxoglutarate transaminase/cysteine-S-conjugate beta-lyase/glutamine--phenylpyruvate transaminase
MPPQFAIDALVEAATMSNSSPHQYTRPAGHPALVQQLARRYQAHLNREIDPMTQVAVTVGASQALFLSLQTLVGPGDEVILFEPFFDLYVNQVKLTGATPVFVPLRFVPYSNDNKVNDKESNDQEEEATVIGGGWMLDVDQLQSAVNSKTKAILLNSPHNPTGKIFTRDEMEHVAAAMEIQAHPDCVVLSDEVYKYIVHAPPVQRAPEESLFCRGHVHFASLPGMWDRTITISSAGKTFSATGWQVGWCIGPSRLIQRIHQLLPYVQFCASTVIQEALARTLPRADEPYEGHASYYDYLRVKFTQKRDILVAGLQAAGFGVPNYSVTPSGGFFIFAQIGPKIRQQLPPERVNAPNRAAPGGTAPLDWALCQWMAEEKGLLCIPAAPFFSPDQVQAGASQDFIRIAFCKSDETLQAAVVALPSMIADDNTNESEEKMLSAERSQEVLVDSLGILGDSSPPITSEPPALDAQLDSLGMLGEVSKPIESEPPVLDAQLDSLGMLGDFSRPIESEPPILDTNLDSLGMLGEVSKPIESEPPILDAQLDSLGMLGTAGMPLSSVSPVYVPPLQEPLGMLGEMSKPLTSAPPTSISPSRVESLGLLDTPPKQPLTFIPTTVTGEDSKSTAPTGTPTQQALVDNGATYGELYKSRSANVVASASAGKSRWGDVENQKATSVGGMSLDTPPAPPKWDSAEPPSSDPLYEFSRQMDDMKRRLDAIQNN